MTIVIPKNICTRTYLLNNNISFSYIYNITNSTTYILKGELSKLWEYIVYTKDYETIYHFAIENNLKINVNNFLSQLFLEKILLTDKPFEKVENKYLMFKIHADATNFNYFKQCFNSVLEQNNIIGRLYLELTHECNLRCKHCCNNKNRNEFISFEDAKKIIDSAYNELGIYKVVITGGECTLNKDFSKIIKYVKEKHLGIKILTNAIKLYDDKELFSQIVDICPSEVQISLYSMNPQIHDNMTGVKGSHHKTLSVIKELRKQQVKVCITSFQSSYNVNSYQEIDEFASSINCSEFHKNCTFIYNRKNNNLKAKLNRIDAESLYTDIIKESQVRNFNNNNNKICVAGTERLSIMPNLDIIPCPYFEYVLGNCRSTEFSKLKNEIIPNFRKVFICSNLKECFKHAYCNYCFYCPAISQFDTGFLKKSELLCEDAQAYYNALKKSKNSI